MSLKLNISLFISILLLISGCTKVAVSPVEQVQQVQQTNSDNAEQVKKVAQRSVVKNQAMSLYLCKNDKEVRILKRQKEQYQCYLYGYYPYTFSSSYKKRQEI